MEHSYLLLLSILYGSSMKIADWLNEHGVRWFKGDAILFGVLWGIFGSLIILELHTDISNILLAMVLAFIIRMRIDYRNHAIATCLIIISFLLFAVFDITIFFPFFLWFLIFGHLRDYLKSSDFSKIFLWLKFGWYYIPSTLLYAFLYDRWEVFWVFASFTTSYNVIKLLGYKYGIK